MEKTLLIRQKYEGDGTYQAFLEYPESGRIFAQNFLAKTRVSARKLAQEYAERLGYRAIRPNAYLSEKRVIRLTDNADLLSQLRERGISVQIRRINSQQLRIEFDDYPALSYIGDDIQLANYIDGIYAGLMLSKDLQEYLTTSEQRLIDEIREVTE